MTSSTHEIAQDATMTQTDRGETWRRLGRESAYVLVHLPLAVVAFIVVVPMLTASIGTLVIWVGLPLLLLTLLCARGFATVERRMTETFTGREMPAPSYHHPAPEAGWWQRFVTVIRDPQSWLDALWVVANLAVSILTFAVGLCWWALAICTVAAPLGRLILQSNGYTFGGLGDLLGLSPTPSLLIDIAVGAVFAATLPRAISALTWLRSTVSHSLLCLRGAYEEKIDRLETSRTAAQSAETTSLRRLERDLHDGPQQRLIRLQMDLARAERIAETDPAAARALMAEARAQAGETLAELRQMSRGIAPPVLVDRGLAAAVEEAAARSEVPVTVQARVGQLPDAVSTAAYFVVTESLANINKHAGATCATVTVGMEGRHLVVTVTDDGVGGASVAKGHGLYGLGERLCGVDGALDVTSPPGGPTVVQAVIPCAS